MEKEKLKLPTVVSRKDLYLQIWATPTSRLAARYGISDRGLAKICNRLYIPYPPRGYWAKKAAGKKVIQYRLPEPTENTPLEITIRPTPVSAQSPELSSEIAGKLNQAREIAAQVVVPERLVKPHPIIAGWLADHERKKREAKQERDPWRRRFLQPTEFTDIDRRKHRILNTLLKLLEGQGFSIKVDQQHAVHFEVLNERIDFQLREKQKQIRRPLTEEEKRWSFYSDKPWRQELKPSGILVFSIKTYLTDGMTHEWIDTPDTPIENRLPDIVAVLSLAAPILTERRRHREDAEKRRQEEEHRRYIEEQLRKQDRNRWRRFLELAEQHNEAENAKRFLATLENQAQPVEATIGDRSAAEWIAWAHEWIKTFDPLLWGPEKIYIDLANIKSWSDRSSN
jgi:hypothetical protein